MKVLILGGYGAMAQSTVPDLLASPGVERVGIAGRSAEKAKTFAAAQRDDRATAVPVDARDSAALVRELKRWDCVINSTWYDLNVPIMEAAIEAGIHYCDLGGLYHQTLRQLKLDARARDAGVTCVLGIGSTPGTMNVMGMHGASKLDKVEKVLLRSSGAVVAGGEPGKFVPPYAIRTIFDEFSLDAPILRKGRIQFVPALSGLERSEFMPPVGIVEGYYTIHSELATMPKTIGKGVKEMDFIVAFPAAFRETIATLVRMGLASRGEIAVEGTKVRPYDVTSSVIDALPKPEEPELDVDIQRCVLVGEKDGNPMTLRYEAVTWPHKEWNVGGGVVDTGVPPSIAAQGMVNGLVNRTGVIPPEIAFDPLPYFKELSARGRAIQIIEYAERTQALN
ncbi:MAG TPA: saccharopine dehydrogenase NADP-binding domain-containing protein [Thermoplasmata archaeon]|nr:saccharopine dehydrogenase NADP-binding domain-containing protein [Thermoplasmata archaeon]